MEFLSVAMQKGIIVYAVKGNWRLDDGIRSKMITMAFSMAAEIKRELISQRARQEQTGQPEIEGLLANGANQKVFAASWTRRRSTCTIG